MIRIPSVKLTTEYGSCEIFGEIQIIESEKKCKQNCIECDNRCEFGYQAAEMLII